MIDFSLTDEQHAALQLEFLRRGVWGTKSLWGRVVTYSSGG
jgi:hypothetical protein